MAAPGQQLRERLLLSAAGEDEVGTEPVVLSPYSSDLAARCSAFAAPPSPVRPGAAELVPSLGMGAAPGPAPRVGMYAPSEAQHLDEAPRGARRARRLQSKAHSMGLVSQLFALSVPVVTLSIMIGIRGASFGGLLLPKALSPALESVGAQHAGTTLFQLSTALGQLFMLRSSGMPFASSGAAFELLPLYAGLGASVLADLSTPEDETAESQISSVLFASGVCTVIVSFSYIVSVRLGLASVFRRCPACVLKGALAGIGSFLLRSSLTTVADHALETHDDFLWFLNMPGIKVVQCTLGMTAGVMLYAMDLRWKSPALFMGALLSIVVVANLVPLLGMEGITHESMEEDGWFFSSPLPAGPWFSVYTAFSWSQINYAAVLSNIPRMVCIALTHQLIVVTDLVNIEAVTGFPVNLEDEFRSIGCTSVLSALTFSLPNYVSIGQTITAWRTGGWVERESRRNSAWKRRSSTHENRVARASLESFRVVGACVALITLAFMPFFPALMPNVPRAFVGCFFTWLAGVFLRESMWEVFFESPNCWSDSVVVLVMMLAMPFVGFLEGILLGLVLSCVTLSFSQTLTTNVIRLRCDGRTIQSNTARLPAHSSFLRHNGSNLVVVHLQGDLGFGTCRQITGLIEDLTERDKAALSSNGGGLHAHAQEEQSALGKFVIVAPAEVKPLYIVVCLRNVTSLDYSAAQQLVKMKNAAVRSHAHTEVNCRKEATPHNIVYTRCRPSVRQTLLQCGCVLPHDIVTRDIPGDMLAQMPPVAICDSYMRALAICEDALLRVATQNALVPPQLPLLPDELDTLEMPNLSNIEAERARERDEGNASQYSVTSFTSQREEDSAHSFVTASAPAPAEANAVCARDLIGIVFGPYLTVHTSTATSISQHLDVILSSLRPRCLQNGEALWRRGDQSLGMFVVHAGKLHISIPKTSMDNGASVPESPPEERRQRRVYVSDPADMQRRISGAAVGVQQSEESLVLEVLIPGSILGFTHALSTPPQPRFTDAVVVSKWAVVHEMPLTVLQQLQTTHPSLAMGIMQCVLHRCAHEYNIITQHLLHNDDHCVFVDDMMT